jgi:ComF family protein
MVIETSAHKLGRQLLDLIAPCYCMVCDLPAQRPIALCRACEAEIATNHPVCARCASPLAIPAPLCGRCLVKPPPFTRTIAPRLYSPPLSNLIKALKFRGELHLVAALAHLLAIGVAAELEKGPVPDYLVPMPLHWWRHWRRGFNQADLLARALCRHPALLPYELSVANRACLRKVATRPQAGLGAAERATNLRLVMHCPRSVQGLQLAVVDDVMTTGASAAAVANALLAAGASRVDVWCCARTADPVSGSAMQSGLIDTNVLP